MIIKRLRLNNFKRFALKGVKDYELIPDTNLTIFTWKNGVGKSSIIQQLNPIPNDFNKDFFQDGFKELEFIHNNKHYLVKESKNHFSLLEDGVELNMSNKKKMQEELVFNIFGLNSKIINVINGYSPLSRMSPSDRKFWISRISNIDYTYPTKIFNTLSEKRRDLMAWKKLAYEKTLELQNLLTNKKDIEEIKEVNEFLKSKVYEILKNMKETSIINLEDIELNLDKNVKLMDRLKIDIKTEDIEKEIEHLVFVYKKNNDTLDNVNKRLELIEKSTTKDELDILRVKHNELLKTISLFINKITTEEEVNIMVSSLNNIVNKLESLLYKELEVKENMRNTPEVKIDVTLVTEEIEKLKASINANNMLLEEYQKASDSTLLKCNVCNSTLDFSKKIEEIKNYIEENKPKLTKLMDTYRNYISFNNLKIHLLKIEEEFIKTKIELNSFHKLDTNVDTIGSLIDNVKIYISNLEKVKELLKESKEIKEKIENASEINNSKDDISKEKENLLNTINKLTEINVKIKERLQVLNNYKKNIIDYSNLREEIKKEIGLANECKKNEINKVYNEYSNMVIDILQNKIKELTELINKNEHFEQNIEQYKKSVDVYDIDIKDYSTLLDILSPTNGLIAKSINSLISTIVNEMNIIINSVWTYKMKILPCDLSEGDLDYKFKVEVNDDFIVEDISKLSSSMQEIIDLAFRLVFIRFSKLGDIPIVLDEFGRTMDREHRINAFNLIDNIICKNFEQVFLVSHFEEMFGRFKNAKFPEI